ncbi:Copia protein [Porphyridium purpureum]|uniref:Copia protein n=1 Tax=Porphyridium purpureum TaxID=35688 RepID=A0A5J4YKM1_PORPP|nr:Copia protein [Porphyridium purpureum]|eukprot:POR4491..scf210_14
MIDAGEDLALGFGDYCQVLSKTVNNTMQERSVGCIALRPTMNLAGSWLFFDLHTKRTTVRQKWIQLPAPEDVVGRVNEIAESKGSAEEIKESLDSHRKESEPQNDVDGQPEEEIDNRGAEVESVPIPETDVEAGLPNEDGAKLGNIHDSDLSLPYERRQDEISARSEALSLKQDVDFNDEKNEVHELSTEDIVDPCDLGIAPEIKSTSATTRQFNATEQSLSPAAVTERAAKPGPEENKNVDEMGIVSENTLQDERTNGNADPLSFASEQIYIGTQIDQLAGKYKQEAEKISMRIEELEKRKKQLTEAAEQEFRGTKRKTEDTKQAKRTKKGRAFVMIKTRDGLAMNMNLRSAFRKYGPEAAKATVREVAQVDNRHGFGVVAPVNVRDLTAEERMRILPTHIFLKEKLDSGGKMTGLKARVVAGGNHQDPTLYPQRSSPTVGTDSVLLLAAVGASSNCAVGKADFPGAFLNAPMPEEGPKVHVTLNRYLSQVRCELDDKYRSFVRKDGSLTCVLNKALYGTVMAEKQWFATVRKMFLEMGFSENKYDQCVFKKGAVTLAIHVDDVIVFAPTAHGVKKVLNEMRTRYPDLKTEQGDFIEYLGMKFDFSRKGEVSVSMNGYVHALIQDFGERGTAKTPAGTGLYEVGTGEPLSAKDRERFHTYSCKLLYVAKRTRPDLLTAVGYLTTRVQEPTARDWDKLRRVIKYLNATRDLKLKLAACKHGMVISGVDASYAASDYFKSVTGAYVTLGTGAVYARRGKQRLVTKSSTEAELVAASDSLGQIVWAARFLKAQGYKVTESILLQDSKSAIALMKNGRPSSARTKHISDRYFVVHDAANKGEKRIVYWPTADLVADTLTKPLQGERFTAHRDRLLWSLGTNYSKLNKIVQK